MPYKIELERGVGKALTKIPRQDQERIIGAIDGLADEPRPPGCAPVRAATKGTYRFRVGSYRVIYAVLDQEQVLIIARVSRRGEGTYRRLG